MSVRRLLCLSLLASSLPAAAYAAATAPATSLQTTNYGDFYVGLDIGAIIPQTTHFSWSGAVSGNGNFNYDMSGAGFGMVGYHFNQYLTGEAELGYTSFKYSDLTGDVPTLGSTTAKIDGQVDNVIGFLNVLLTPFDLREVKPYIGGGVGFVNSDSKINSVSFGGTNVGVGTSNDETSFAANGMIGIDALLGAGFTFGARCQYIWADSGETFTSNGTTEQNGNLEAYIVTAQVTYHF